MDGDSGAVPRIRKVSRMKMMQQNWKLISQTKREQYCCKETAQCSVFFPTPIWLFDCYLLHVPKGNGRKSECSRC